MVHGEEDFTKRMKGVMDLYYIKSVTLKDPTVPACIPVSIEHVVQIDHEQILGAALKSPTVAQCLPVSVEHTVDINHIQVKGVTLQDPTIAACLPASIENPAIAYNSADDRFKIDIEDAMGVTFTTDETDDWTRQLGAVDLARVLGSALSYANPVIARLTDGSAFIDPRDVSDRAARLLGVVYGSQGQQLLQRATTYDLIAQLRHEGVEIDPRAIRALTNSDAISVYGSVDKLQQRATSKDLIVQIQHQGVEKDPTAIRALTSADVVTAQQTTRTSMTVKPEREDLTSLGGVASPNNAGVQILAPSGQLKPKVFDAEYEALAAGLHYFYFGTSTAATTRRFLSRTSIGVNSKSFVSPRVGNAADGIYLFSAVSETNMPYDLAYALEA